MNEIIKNMLKDNIDLNLFAEKGLIISDELSDRFYTLYKNYKILLEKYFLQKCNLKEYDERVINSKLFFVPVEPNFMDNYQYISSMGLKYFYLRNDLSVEKLSVEEINMIINLSVQELSFPSLELLNFIEGTYKKVIDSKLDNSDKLQINCYGPNNERFWINSNELVFAFRYDEIADNGLGEGIEWRDNYFKQTNFLNNLFNEMSVNLTNILGVKVNLIQYNDFTVVNSMKR